jgi:polar amino acid transport system substrate-binding protein
VTRTRPILACLLAAILTFGVAGCANEPKLASVEIAVRTDSALHNALPSYIRAAKVIRVATDASYAPASSFARDGHTIIGFEPDLGAALGEVLGTAVLFVNEPFATLPNMVRDGKVDLVMSAMTDTQDREKYLDFIDYFIAGSTIVVQRGNPSDISDLGSLCGHTVAIETGTVQVDLVNRVQRRCPADRPILLSLFRTNTDALVQVRTGRADASLSDYPSAVALASDSRTSAYYQLAARAQYHRGPYGIAIAKDQPQLRDAVAQALGILIGSGRYKQILTKWGVASGAVSSVVVNGSGT